MRGIYIRHLSFIGPEKKPASVSFGPGLNVIFGDSEMGKSFIGESIDFMLGGQTPLSDIAERIGYTRVLLGFETYADEAFTLVRSADGGPFHVFDGLHIDAVPSKGGAELAAQHNEKRDDNLSTFILEKAGLSHKRVRRNKRGDTQNLTLRSLVRLLLITEDEIHVKRSPLSDGNFTADPANASIFKLLLTGIDDEDSASEARVTPEEQKRDAQLDLLDELINDYALQVTELAGPPSELDDQLGRIENTLQSHEAMLSASERHYRELSTRQRGLLKRLEDGRNRLTEIASLLSRFSSLEKFYASDLDRLMAIRESGSIFVALGKTACPLCGSAPEYHQAERCDGDVEATILAADAEIGKIQLQQIELSQTILALTKERKQLEPSILRVETEAVRLSESIQKIVAPNLRDLRRTYREYTDKRSEVMQGLAVYRNLQELNDRKAKLLSQDSLRQSDVKNSDSDLSTAKADKFSNLVLFILKSWHFPNVERVHFDMKIRDLVINGRVRTSFGKGLRAITQAAFTIALLEFCRQNKTLHPGFVVLDSPLLSYRDTENDEDGVRQTDINHCFYSYLSKMSDGRQVIIIENTDPPEYIKNLPQALELLRRPKAGGRRGFFPA